MDMVHNSIFIVGLNLIWIITSYAAPFLDLNNSWGQNDVAPIIRSACSPNGRCWGWLPVSEIQDDVSSLATDFGRSRVPTRRQINDAGPDSVLESWKVDNPRLETEIRPTVPTSRQVSNRITKKDAFLSRGWGAGGMPFSVLYMKPHGPRSTHASSSVTGKTQQQETKKVTESSTPLLDLPNYRIALRNGASGQPRRQYSIIPHLFMSYGWGPLGK